MIRTTIGVGTVFAAALCLADPTFAQQEPGAQQPAQPGAAAPPAGEGVDPRNAGAEAFLRDPSGALVGHALLFETQSGVVVVAGVTGLPPGAHGFHVHEVGRCDAPEFASAGEHFAPQDRAHGFQAEGGPHAGDMLNLHVPASGNVTVSRDLRDGKIGGGGAMDLLGGDGTALVIHSGADDYRSQPSGNAGGRIACGVVQRLAAEPPAPVQNAPAAPAPR